MLIKGRMVFHLGVLGVLCGSFAVTFWNSWRISRKFAAGPEK